MEAVSTWRQRWAFSKREDTQALLNTSGRIAVSGTARDDRPSRAVTEHLASGTGRESLRLDDASRLREPRWDGSRAGRGVPSDNAAGRSCRPAGT